MDITFLSQYVNVLIFGICLIVGYVIKNAFDSIPNKYIPLAVTCLGLILAFVTNTAHWSLDVALTGMVSGLASTGCYELLRNLFFKEDK